MNGYVIFDCESRIDKALLNATLYRGEGLSDEDALHRHKEELRAKNGRDMPSVVFHVPISITAAAVGADHRLRELKSFAGGERDLVEAFWRMAETWKGCLVTFGGRSFDLPLLELHALKHGVSARNHFGAKYGARYRFQTDAHLDLYDFLTGYGASSIRGGLDALLRLCGLEGKGDVSGKDVQELWENGRLEEIHAYCRRDVMSTYLLFLRVQVVRGLLPASVAEQLTKEATASIGE
jgi:predicted PolB exonuclease-like 3'-5' exonuclease